MHIYTSLYDFIKDHPSFSLSKNVSQDGDWEDQVFDWLSSEKVNILCCSEDAIIYSTK